MKKFIVVLLIAVLKISVVFSQSLDTENIPLSKTFPTAPESASLGRYGGLENSSSTGQISQVVPLHTISVSNAAIDIALNYHYSGLLLNEKPSTTGLGWTLLATGVVNREVRGVPDETRFGYYGAESKRNLIANFNSLDDLTVTELNRFNVITSKKIFRGNGRVFSIWLCIKIRYNINYIRNL